MAKQDHSTAQCLLGWTYNRGYQYGKEEIPEGDELLLQSAKQGNILGLHHMGQLYYRNHDKKYRKWTHKAAEFGHLRSQVELVQIDNIDLLTQLQ